MQQTFQTIAFTHRSFDVTEIGLLHIQEDDQKARLNELKTFMNWEECMFLSTCNRVEFLFCSDEIVSEERIEDVLKFLHPELSYAQLLKFGHNAEFHQGDDAIHHVFNVASSIESMVLGEREIITQVRNAYERSLEYGLTGDFLRVLMRQTIEVAKKVYTNTDISKNSVSVVALAYHRMKDLAIPLDARMVIIGAGATNTTLGRFLKKHGYTDFTVFNRTFSKAKELAEELNGDALPLSEINDFKKGFDVLIACTGTDGHIVTPELYESLLGNDTDKKLVIDIAVPQDLDPQIVETHPVHHISVSMLQKISDENLRTRSFELEKVKEIIAEGHQKFLGILKERHVEKAMRHVPQQVRKIKDTAINEVFKDDIDQLDEKSKETLENILGYIEKKYMSMPMIMAKQVLLNKTK